MYINQIFIIKNNLYSL